MKKRVWIYVNSPSNSKRTILSQLNQLAGFVIRKDYVIVGVSVDDSARKRDFYERDGFSGDILDTAAEGKFDILLLTNLKLIIPQNGWGDLMRFNKRLNGYGVQVFDLIIQDVPLENTADQLIERVFGCKIFSIKEDKPDVYKFYHTGASCVHLGK